MVISLLKEFKLLLVMLLLNVLGIIIIMMIIYRQAHNSIPYQATKQPSLSAMPSTMYNYPMMMYPMYQQPYLYPMANNINQYVQQGMQQSIQQNVQQNMQQSIPLGQVEQPVQQQTQSTQTQQPQMRKKGESLSQSIRKLEDGRPYPSDYSTNSLKYILLFKISLIVTCLILNLVIIMKVNHNSIIVFLVI